MRRPRPTYANVTSSIALFVALGGVSWAAATLPKNSVGSTQLKKNAVTSTKIKDGQVKAGELASKAVTNAKLADGAVTVGKLGEGSVTVGKLGEGAVTTGKLGDGSVTNGKLGDGAATTAKLADNAVNGAKLADGSVSGSDIANGAITPANLGGDLIARSVAAYASIDGFGPTINQPYNKNIISVTRNGGAGRYCLNVDWAAAGRTPAQQASPIIASARSTAQLGSADVYNGACPNNGISVQLNTVASGGTTGADGWVHVLIP